MLAILNIIKTAYEEENMQPETIALDQSLEIEAVKGALMQCSSKYRKDCGQDSEDINKLKYSFDEQMRVKEALLDLALSAEDEHLRGKLLINVRDDAMGRKDVIKVPQGTNIFNFNQRIMQVREAAARLTNNIKGQKAINV